MSRSRSRSPFLAIALVAAALARAARADEPAAPDEPIAAEPKIEAEVVVRGARRPQAGAALAPGAAVTIVDAARFAGEVKGAGELLATSPGVAVTDHGGIGRHAFVSIRGASAEQVKVLVDGVPINPTAGGGVDLSSIPPQWISRIEVVRGTEGVHHGSGALGGVVNVVTAPPRAKTWSAGATGGSFGTWQADAQAGTGGEGWGVLGSLAASRSVGRFTYVYEGTAQARDHNASELAGALLKAYALAGGGRLDAAVQLSGGERDLPGGPNNGTPDDWQEDARGLASARWRVPGPGGLHFTTAASTRVDRLSVQLRDHVGGRIVRQRGAAGTGSIAAQWAGAHGSLEAAVEAGAERLRAGGIGDHSRATYALVLAGEVSALGGRARLGPGVRLERAGDFDGASAKLGGSVAIAGPLSLRASAGRTYRVPSFAELYLLQGVVAPNPDLRPEVGIGGDAAVVAEGSLGTASVGAFATLYRDLVVYQLASFRQLQPQNDARSRVRGVEAELATAPLPRLAGLSTRLAYTFTDSATLRGKDNVLGMDLPRKPRHRLYARLGVGGAAADAHGEVQWISEQWLAFGRTAPIDEALTLGAGASVRLWKAAGLRLHVEVRNLLDDRSLDDTYGNPLPGRTVLATIRAGNPTETR
jgi:vitamin B12 transporter